MLATLCLSLSAHAESYFSVWQKNAIELKLPTKFAALPWALTNCDVNFHTRHTEGPWALAAPIAVRHGLQVDDAIDTRRNPILAGKVALTYLKELATLYNNDETAMLAAYLYPIYKEQAEAEAIKILKDLPKLAATPSQLQGEATTTTYVEVTLQNTAHIDTLLKHLDIHIEELRAANPHLLRNAKILSAQSTLQLTPETFSRFKTHEEQIYRATNSAISATEQQETEIANKQNKTETSTTKSTANKPTYITYKVKNGDTLGHIAQKYHVTVAQLVKWNRITNANYLKLGQTLKIYKK